MKYWGWLAAKLAAGGALLFGLWVALHTWYPFPAYFAQIHQDPFMHDLPWTTLMFVYNMLCNAVLVLIIIDQRYRCRSCGRRLRMPVSSGSHAHVLFGPPRTDYICIYGHGTLQVSELELTGPEKLDWTPHDDNIWKELYSLTGKVTDEDQDAR
jgi:hypothetical protein